MGWYEAILAALISGELAAYLEIRQTMRFKSPPPTLRRWG